MYRVQVRDTSGPYEILVLDTQLQTVCKLISTQNNSTQNISRRNKDEH